MQRGPVDERLGVAVERPVLDQLEVEVGRTLEDRVLPGLTTGRLARRTPTVTSSWRWVSLLGGIEEPQLQGSCLAPNSHGVFPQNEPRTTLHSLPPPFPHTPRTASLHRERGRCQH